MSRLGALVLLRLAKDFFLLLESSFRNGLKRIQLYPLGFRSHYSTSIAWSVSADGGGNGGRVIVGKKTTLDVGVVLRAYGGSIDIGDHCSVNPYSVLYGDGGLKIGNGVRIAAHCVIVSANHRFDDLSRFIYLQGQDPKRVVIEDDVWIGAGARILHGVTIRKGTVVAAGAVVTKSTEGYSIVAGVPARKISTRIPAGSSA